MITKRQLKWPETIFQRGKNKQDCFVFTKILYVYWSVTPFPGCQEDEAGEIFARNGHQCPTTANNSFPPISRHCSTCSCQKNPKRNANELVQKRKTKDTAAAEWFENESAKKQTDWTESALIQKEGNSVPVPERKMLMIPLTLQQGQEKHTDQVWSLCMQLAFTQKNILCGDCKNSKCTPYGVEKYRKGLNEKNCPAICDKQ